MTDAASNSIDTGASEGSGRIFLVTEPALPATCLVCARSANGTIRFIDFNFSFDYYGAVVVCEDCMKESLTLLDYTPNINFTDKVSELERVQKELEVVVHELIRYKSAFDALDFIRPDLNPLSVDDGDESEELDESVDESESTDGQSVGTESDSNGSDPVGGLKNLSIFAD